MVSVNAQATAKGFKSPHPPDPSIRLVIILSSLLTYFAGTITDCSCEPLFSPLDLAVNWP